MVCTPRPLSTGVKGVALVEVCESDWSPPPCMESIWLRRHIYRLRPRGYILEESIFWLNLPPTHSQPTNRPNLVPG